MRKPETRREGNTSLPPLGENCVSRGKYITRAEPIGQVRNSFTLWRAYELLVVALDGRNKRYIRRLL